MILRPVADMAELEHAFDVAGAADPIPGERMDHSDWRFDAVRDAFPGDQDVDLVALEGDEILGAVLSFRDEGGVRARLLGVRPVRQRQGVGRALMRELCEAAWRAGDTRVHLGAVPTAVGFYQACGFSVVEVLHDGATTVFERLRPMS